MPIAALSEQNDARGSAWLLARMARASIAEPGKAPVNAPAMNSLYRLLEAYRAHRFFGFDYQPPVSRDSESYSIHPPTERGFGELKAAFHDALTKVYGSSGPQEEGISAVEEVLASVTYADRPQVERTAYALELFLQEIKRAQIYL